jgi:argininosuccinate synthase
VDVELRQTLWQFIARLNKEGHTVLLTTHYLEEAEALCQRIGMLKGGRLVALDSTSPLLAGTAHTMLRFKTDAALPAEVAARARVTGRIVQVTAHDAVEVETTLAALRAAGVPVEDLEIGRADLEETRTVGMKSRGVYETPAGTILYTALRELEMLCLDGETLEMKKNLANTYARLVYTGKWFTAFRVNLDAFFTSSSRYLTGEVNLVLYKGNVLISGRQSKYSLYSEDLASFGKSNYDHHDATGFLKLYSLATGVQASVQQEWNKA